MPLLPPARAALQEQRDHGGVVHVRGLVFTGRQGPHQKGYAAQWPTWRRRCGLRRELVFHSLRHTCASHLVMGTWGRAWRLEEIAQVLGHKDVQSTQRYAELAPEGMARTVREARERWSW